METFAYSAIQHCKLLGLVETEYMHEFRLKNEFLWQRSKKSRVFPKDPQEIFVGSCSKADGIDEISCIWGPESYIWASMWSAHEHYPVELLE